MQTTLTQAFAAAFPWTATAVCAPRVGAQLYPMRGPSTERVVRRVHLADALRGAAGGAFAGLADRVFVRGAFEVLRRVKHAPELTRALSELEESWCSSVSQEQEKELRITPVSWDTPGAFDSSEFQAPFKRPSLVMYVRAPDENPDVMFAEAAHHTKMTRAEWASLLIPEMVLKMKPAQSDDEFTLYEFMGSAFDYLGDVEAQTGDATSHLLTLWKRFVPRALPRASGEKLFYTPEEYAALVGDTPQVVAQEFRNAVAVYPYPRTRTRWEETSKGVMAPPPAGGGGGAQNKLTFAEYARVVDPTKNVQDFLEIFLAEKCNVKAPTYDAASVSREADAEAHEAMHRVLDTEKDLFDAWDTLVDYFKCLSFTQAALWEANLKQWETEIIRECKTYANGLPNGDLKTKLEKWSNPALLIAEAINTRNFGALPLPAAPDFENTTKYFVQRVLSADPLWGRINLDAPPPPDSPVARLKEIDSSSELSALRGPSDYAAYLLKQEESSLLTREALNRNRELARGKLFPTLWGAQLRDVRAFAAQLKRLKPDTWYDLCALLNPLMENTTRKAFAAHTKFLDSFKKRWERDVQIVAETSFLAQRGRWAMEMFDDERSARLEEADRARVKATAHLKTRLVVWFCTWGSLGRGQRAPSPPADARVVGFSKKTGEIVCTTGGVGLWPIAICGRGAAAEAQIMEAVARIIQTPDAPAAFQLRGGFWALKAKSFRDVFAAAKCARIAAAANDADRDEATRTACLVAATLARFGVVPDLEDENSRFTQGFGLYTNVVGAITPRVAKVGEPTTNVDAPNLEAGPTLAERMKRTIEVLGLEAPPPPPPPSAPEEEAGMASVFAPEIPPRLDPPAEPKLPQSLMLREDTLVVEVAYADSTNPEWVTEIPLAADAHEWCVEANRFLRDTPGALQPANLQATRAELAGYMRSVELVLRDAPRPPTPVIPMAEPEPTRTRHGPLKKKKRVST
jgi:hypothetical protein